MTTVFNSTPYSPKTQRLIAAVDETDNPYDFMELLWEVAAERNRDDDLSDEAFINRGIGARQ